MPEAVRVSRPCRLVSEYFGKGRWEAQRLAPQNSHAPLGDTCEGSDLRDWSRCESKITRMKGRCLWQWSDFGESAPPGTDRSSSILRRGCLQEDAPGWILPQTKSREDTPAAFTCPDSTTPWWMSPRDDTPTLSAACCPLRITFAISGRWARRSQYVTRFSCPTVMTIPSSRDKATAFIPPILCE